jgi:hypothetical protein
MCACLRRGSARRAACDVFELQIQFVRVPVGTTAERAAIVRQHHFDLCIMRFEGGDDIMNLDPAASLCRSRHRRLHHGLCSYAEVLVQIFGRRTGTIAGHADEFAV